MADNGNCLRETDRFLSAQIRDPKVKIVHGGFDCNGDSSPIMRERRSAFVTHDATCKPGNPTMRPSSRSWQPGCTTDSIGQSSLFDSTSKEQDARASGEARQMQSKNPGTLRRCRKVESPRCMPHPQQPRPPAAVLRATKASQYLRVEERVIENNLPETPNPCQ
jgi:hypothetical protein